MGFFEVDADAAADSTAAAVEGASGGESAGARRRRRRRRRRRARRRRRTSYRRRRGYRRSRGIARRDGRGSARRVRERPRWRLARGGDGRPRGSPRRRVRAPRRARRARDDAARGPRVPEEAREPCRWSPRRTTSVPSRAEGARSDLDLTMRARGDIPIPSADEMRRRSLDGGEARAARGCARASRVSGDRESSSATTSRACVRTTRARGCAAHPRKREENPNNEPSPGRLPSSPAGAPPNVVLRRVADRRGIPQGQSVPPASARPRSVSRFPIRWIFLSIKRLLSFPFHLRAARRGRGCVETAAGPRRPPSHPARLRTTPQ